MWSWRWGGSVKVVMDNERRDRSDRAARRVSGARLARRAGGGAVPPGPAAAVAYLLGSQICHQIAERSFHLAGAQLPVCARCTGIYAGFAAGVVLATLSRRVGGLTPLGASPGSDPSTVATQVARGGAMVAIGGAPDDRHAARGMGGPLADVQCGARDRGCIGWRGRGARGDCRGGAGAARSRFVSRDT